MKTYEHLKSTAAWLKKQFSIVRHQKEHDSILKLINYERAPYNKEPKVEIQLKGKNLFIKKAISGLFSNDDILKSFSKEDVATLVRIHEQWVSSSKVQVTGHYYNCDTCFVTVIDSSGKEKKLPLYDAIYDENIKSALSGKDSYLVGYLLGYEDGKEIRS